MRQTVRSRSIDKILDDVFRQYRDYFLPLFLLTLVFSAPFVLLTSAVTGTLPAINYAALFQGQHSAAQFLNQMKASQHTPIALTLELLAAQLGIALVQSLVATPLLSGTYYLLGAETLERDSAVKQPITHYLRQAVGRWGAFASTWLLVTVMLLVAVAAYVGIIIAVVATAFAMASHSVKVTMVIAIVLLYLALLVIMIWLNVRVFMLVFVAVVVEKKRNWGAIARAWKLTRGSFWRLFGIAIVAYLVIAIASAGLNAVATFTLPTNTLRTAASGLINVLTGPLMGLLMINLYVDLRVRKEGYDIELLAREDS